MKVDKETRDQLSDILCKCSFEDKKEKQIYFDYLSLQKYKEKNYVEAIQYCEKALIINENEKINTLVYYRAAILYKELNKLEVARMYADKAKVGFIKMNSHKRYIHSEIILASIYCHTKNFPASLQLYDECLHAAKEIANSESLQGMIVRSKAWVFILAKNYLEALQCIADADKIQKDHPNCSMYRIWCAICLNKFNLAIQLINNYAYLKKDCYYASRFELLSELAYLKDNKPTKTIIAMAIKVYENFTEQQRFDVIGFYLDIVIQLYERADDSTNQIFYLNKKIALLQNTY